MTEYVTSNIHSVLKKYQNSAPKSLQGPGHALAAAAAAAAAANCILDAAIASDVICGIGSSGGGITSSLCEMPDIVLNGGTVSSSKCQQQTPAALLIKKEVLSSPEPNELSDHQSVPLNTATAATVSVVVAPPIPPPQIYPPPPPELSQPILSMADSCSGDLYETRLEGKTIGCFSLGGEMRLCLPQFLNNVLADFTLEQINRIFDELGIFCSQCTPDQLIEFKAAKILPSDVKASGLITRTDAERLCAALLHRSDRNSYIPVESLAKGALSFRVYHKCFGKCEGICTPDMYSYQKPTCIKCLECDGWFSPQKFVGHVHRQFENRTCHWGFDSRNWHDYLHVAVDVENREKYQRILDELKEVEIKETFKVQREFDYKKRKMEMLMDDKLGIGLQMGQHGLAHGLLSLPSQQGLPANIKHRDELIDIPTKKHKSLDEATAYQLDIQRYQSLMYAHCVQQQRVGQMSAFRPWGPSKSFLHAYNASAVAALSTLPYLSQEPPVLQNPERVVRSKDRELFEHTYQPNVALAPRKNITTKEREKEQKDLRDREQDRERGEHERDREIERQRQRGRSRERDREKVRENDRERQIDFQQHRNLHQQQHLKPSDIKETELHIKQERANTPMDIPSTSPIHSSVSNNEELRLERYSNDLIDENTAMPLLNPITLSIGQHQYNSGNANASQQIRQSVQTSNSPSACSSASPTLTEATFTPKQKLISAHLPPQVTKQCQTQPHQTQTQRHVQHLPLEKTLPLSQPPHMLPPTNTPSPEVYSASSTEITSSTSPKATISIGSPNEKLLGLKSNQPKGIVTINQHAKLLPLSSAASTIIVSNNELPSRIRINKNLINSANIIRSPTPPSSAATNQNHVYDFFKQHQQPTQHEETAVKQQRVSARYQQQIHSPIKSSNAGLNLSTNASTHTTVTKANASNQITTTTSSTTINLNPNNNIHESRHHQNGTKPHMGSEFELSTDTDDDSLHDEVNSSGMLPPWEMAVDALRDTRPRDRERILHLLQRLIQENQQYRYSNIQLSEILHKRDALIMELRDELHQCRCELEHFLCEGHHPTDNASGREHNTKIISFQATTEEKPPLREPIKRLMQEATFNKERIDCNRYDDDEETTISDETKNNKKLKMKRQHYKITNVERGGQSPFEDHGNKRFKMKQGSIEAVEPNQSTQEGNSSDTEDSSESVEQTVKNMSPITVAKQPDANGNVQASASIRTAGDEESRQSHYTATEASDESPNEESADEEGTDDNTNNMEQTTQRHIKASQSNALTTPPTSSSPISPEAAATAGKLFDSSNSSDELSMKKAQISASNALAKMSSEEAAEPVDEQMESEDEENTEDNNAGDHDCDADEVSLQQRQQQQQQQKEPRKAVTSEIVRRSHCHDSHHLKERTNYVNNCDKPYATVTPLPSLPRTLTLQTKASKKQTSTTNCELQIKEEIV